MSNKKVDDFRKAQNRKSHEVFVHLLFQWQHRPDVLPEERTLNAFAERIHYSQPLVSGWKKGVKPINDENRKNILAIFREDGIVADDEDPFSFDDNSSDDRYRYDELFVNDLIEKYYKNSSNEISKDDFENKIEPFLCFLKTIPGYSIRFPLYSNIVEDPRSRKLHYIREKAITDEEVCESVKYSCYQIDRFGRTKMLRLSDIEYIAELREKVCDFIVKQFEERNNSLNEALDMANYISLMETRKLTPNEILMIDYINMGKTVSGELEERLAHDAIDLQLQKQGIDPTECNEEKGD